MRTTYTELLRNARARNNARRALIANEIHRRDRELEIRIRHEAKLEALFQEKLARARAAKLVSN